MFSVPWDTYYISLIKGAIITIEYTAAGFLGAVILGLVLALCRLNEQSVISHIAYWITEAFKNVPLITQIFIVYFGLSSVGINLSAFVAGSLALTVHYSAYLSEIFRSGIKAVDKGQREAGLVLGMTKPSIFKKIIFPQAVLIATPGTGTMLVDLLKGSSLMVAIGGAELMTQGQIITSATFRALEVYIIIGAIYFALCFPLSSLMYRIEKKLAKGEPFTARRKRTLMKAKELILNQQKGSKDQ